MSTEVDVVRRGFGGLFSKPGTSAAGAVLAALVVVSSVLVLRSEARSEVLPDLSDGHAWLRSTAVGHIALVDGVSGSVITAFVVAGDGEDFEAQPQGSDAVVVNRGERTVKRLLANEWAITERSFERDVVDVLVGETASWVVESGSVRSLDLDAFSVGAPLSVGDAYDTGHVNRDGALFYGSSDPGAAPFVVKMIDGAPVKEPIDGLRGAVEFAELDDMTAVVAHDGQVWTEKGGMVCSSLPITSNGVVAAGGYDRLLVVTANGQAFFWNPEEPCPDGGSVIVLGDSEYGTPAVGDGWAVVPDLVTGDLVVILPDAEPKRFRPTLLPDGAAVEVVAEHDNIWFNDPGSQVAGVVLRDGTAMTVDKYTDGDNGVPTPKQAEQEDDSNDTGNQVLGDGGDQSEPGGLALEESDDESSSADSSPTTTPALPAGDDGANTTTTASPVVDGPAGPTTSPALPTAEPNVGGIQIRTSISTPKVGERVRYRAEVGGAPVRGEWRVDPDDGSSPDSGDDFYYTFGAPGSHVVRVEVCELVNLCTEVSLAVEVVNASQVVALKASFTPVPDAQVNESVLFESTSQGAPDDLRWTFEGGSPSTATGSRVTVAWSEAGPHAVTLVASRHDGDRDTATGVVMVSAATTSTTSPPAVTTEPPTPTTAPSTSAPPSATTSSTPTTTSPTTTSTTAPSTTSSSTTPANPHTVTKGPTSAESDDFSFDVTTDGCTTQVWTLSDSTGVLANYGESTCLLSHTFSPRTTLTLTPNTTYVVSVTFTFEDLSTQPEEWQVTTLPATTKPPQVVLSLVPSGAVVTVIVTTPDACTTFVDGDTWFSSIDGDPVDRGGLPPSAPCDTTHTRRFTRQDDGQGGYRPYRVNVSMRDPLSGLVTSMNRDI